MLQPALARLGVYYAKRRFMPSGVDWLWDIHRVLNGRSLGTAIDVGANVGRTAASIKERFPLTAVHAIEPVPDTYETLKRNCAGLGNVRCHRLALSDMAAPAWVTAGPNSELNHLVATQSDADGQLEAVDVTTLDDFCEAQSVETIGLLKIDAEGNDLKILEGGRRLFAQRRVAFLFAEVGFDPADTGHVHATELLAFLPHAGFRPYAFYDYYYERVDLVFANVLCVSPAALSALT